MDTAPEIKSNCLNKDLVDLNSKTSVCSTRRVSQKKFTKETIETKPNSPNGIAKGADTNTKKNGRLKKIAVDATKTELNSPINASKDPVSSTSIAKGGAD